MFETLVKSVFGSSNDRYVKSMGKIVDKINALEPMIQELSDEALKEQRVALVNPVVTWESPDVEKQSEGCLSIPGLEEVVQRPSAVRVEGMDPEGNEVAIDADELYARALQHEIDHINGILFVDRVSPLKRRILLKKWKKLEAEGS